MMPVHAKLSPFAYIISGERSANRPKQLRDDAFHVKTSQSAKNYRSSILQKMKISQKFDIRLFCTKPFNLLAKTPRLARQNEFPCIEPV